MIRPTPSLAALALAAAFPFVTAAAADLSLPSIFSDHMVLQRGQAVPIWGECDPEQKVLVTFAGQRIETVSDKDGRWMAELEPLEASAEPAILAAHANGKRVAFDDVLVGEVWLASGQSNMQWSTSRSANPEDEIADAKHPQIRLWQAAMTAEREPQDDVEVTSKDGGWIACSPETIPNFSAVGYFFGRELHRELGVPVGIIQSAWGGTRAEAWTSRGSLLQLEVARPLLVDWRVEEILFEADGKLEEYEAVLEKWAEHNAAVREHNENLAEGEEKREFRSKPREPEHPADSRHCPANLFNGMIHPIVPFAIKGAIWYQGESNVDRAVQYAEIFPNMISDWREHWGYDFPFHFVQLANFRESNPEAGQPSPWAELQWAQTQTLAALEGTGMAVTNDIGMARNIHPTNKQDVGARLAAWSLHHDYGQEEVVPSGPLYRDMRVQGNKIRVRFDHAEGLATSDGEAPGHFQIAGANKRWHWAQARIQNNEVVVSCPQVKKPTAVRYAWASNPEAANLVNAAGLPASLFRTDDWPLRTDGLLSPFTDEVKAVSKEIGERNNALRRAADEAAKAAAKAAAEAEAEAAKEAEAEEQEEKPEPAEEVRRPEVVEPAVK